MTLRYKLACLIFPLLLLFGGVLIFFLPLPPLWSNTHFSKAFYDRHHRLLRLTLSQDEKYRLFTPLEQISPTLIQTTLLQEDQHFWHHCGINPVSILRAVWTSYVRHSHRVGASTITMQVAHLRYGIRSKKPAGKMVQILRAIQLEMHYSKKQILEAYLNLAPYGNNIEGVGAASLIYFNKPVHDINLLQALTLSVIPQNPNKRTPNNKHLQDIRNRLFMRWLKQHPDDIKQQTLIYLPLEMRRLQDLPFTAPHFVNHVLNDEQDKSYETITTLDTGLQTLLSRVTRNYINRKKIAAFIMRRS